VGHGGGFRHRRPLSRATHQSQRQSQQTKTCFHTLGILSPFGSVEKSESTKFFILNRFKPAVSLYHKIGNSIDSKKRFPVRCSHMLYVVATPIGNLGDITLRALEALKEADLVAAEDTRHSGFLLKHYKIDKALISFHQHNEAMRTAQLVRRLETGDKIALITDAGTPGISDPGIRLVRECIRRGFPFTIIPGPSSILAALVGSGFSTAPFFFGGFLPVKSGQREKELTRAAARAETSIYFESPFRLTKTLTACVNVLPDRQICVARELTKKFEEFRRGTAGELVVYYETHPPKGEIVLLISDRK
jgi:16S rRNA (cytidine1402-2'-O)-methyltransferase